MSELRPRVVLDTVVFVQSMISGRGPAAGCVEEARAGRIVLLMSDATFAELKDVPLRAKFVAKYPYVTAPKVAAFVAEIETLAVRISRPPTVFTLPRDPMDEPFIDLAVAGSAQFIVTWNERHLTYLMDQDTPEGVDFCRRSGSVWHDEPCTPPSCDLCSFSPIA
jgi:putative PIN family toxin of toxin-antitoxin system